MSDFKVPRERECCHYHEISVLSANPFDIVTAVDWLVLHLFRRAACNSPCRLLQECRPIRKRSADEVHIPLISDVPLQSYLILAETSLLAGSVPCLRITGNDQSRRSGPATLSRRHAARFYMGEKNEYESG